jgi:hypothetical protein
VRSKSPKQWDGTFDAFGYFNLTISDTVGGLGLPLEASISMPRLIRGMWINIKMLRINPLAKGVVALIWRKNHGSVNEMTDSLQRILHLIS